MKLVILHVICEGQTEEAFTKRVLAPYLSSMGIVAKPTVVVTNRKANARGGVVNFAHLERDILLTLNSFRNNNFEAHYVTTFVDFYALPNDFPGYGSAKKRQSPYEQVKCLEDEMDKHIGDAHFFSYIQLHEFEALVFCGYQHLAAYYAVGQKLEDQLRRQLEEFETPELINGGENTAPSKRILKLIEDDYKQDYNKPMMGELVTDAVGIPTLRKLCPHFDEWVGCIVALANK